MDISSAFSKIEAAKAAQNALQTEAHVAQVAMPALLSGEAAFVALEKAIDELTPIAPEDHDVIIEAFDLTVHHVFYCEPHTFLFSGLNQEGQKSFVVAHFSQLVARIVYRPKRGSSREITGFKRVPVERSN